MPEAKKGTTKWKDITAAMDKRPVAFLMHELIEMYKTMGAREYMTLKVINPEDNQAYEITVHRAEGETPTDRAERLEREVQKLKGVLREHLIGVEN